MIINSIKDISDKYKAVYFDNGFVFKAKNWEIIKLNLKIDMDIEQTKYEYIFEEFGVKRCRFKAIDILSRADKSENELRKKLHDSYFAQDVITIVIEQLKGKKYIDDERVANNYVNVNKYKYTKSQLAMKLYTRGIDKEIVSKALEEEYDSEAEKGIILKYCSKYVYDCDKISYKDYCKIVSAMYRKGINSTTVSRIIEEKYIIDNNSDCD